MPKNNIIGVMSPTSLALIHFNTEENLFSFRHYFENIFKNQKFSIKDFTFASDNIFILSQNGDKKSLAWLKIRRKRTYAREVGKLFINEILKEAGIEKEEEIPTVSSRGYEEVTEFTEDQSMTMQASDEKKSNFSKSYKTLKNSEKSRKDDVRGFNSSKPGLDGSKNGDFENG